ncbi:MAG: AAC(3) family N-acetyltransferase, partial [Planctomycetota bacterium]|nr:AAC(3) family N-acetyltransferase [Planctomycetota bacterium]
MSADLEAIGVRQGGYMLVHSSLSSLGFVPGSATAVVAALRDSMGLNGTLVLPSHSWLWMNKGAREFDVRRTPTCVGALPEFFRNQPSVVRSLHPTHSVAAIGPQAEPLIE